MVPPDPLGLVGQILDGQYRVERFVGEGGFGVVYRGQHLGLSEPIAIKCMKLPALLNPALVESFVQRFRDESRLHYKLSQGNLHIARTIAAGTTLAPATSELVPYMILEWLDGRSLAAEFETHERRSLEAVFELFTTAVDALTYAQEQGVIHRDLNPGNFFLTDTIAGPRLKVLDFGVAKVLDESRLAVGPRAQTLGQMRIFAPAYGAPEQFDDRLGPVGAHTDVYALALVLLEAMSGRTVMTGEHLGDFANGALDPATRPSPSWVGLALSAEVEAVFARALCLRPVDRWPGVKEFWAALRLAARLPSDDGAKATQMLASMELPGGAEPESGAQSSESTMVDSVEEAGERTELGLGPLTGGASAVEPAPMTARIGPMLEVAAEAPPAPLLVAEPAAVSPPPPPPGAPAPWAPPSELRRGSSPAVPAVQGPPLAHPGAHPTGAEPRPRPPPAHSATLAMPARPSLEPLPPAPALARQMAPLAATMAMPRPPSEPALARASSVPHPPSAGPAATQALVVGPPAGLMLHGARESEGAQRASVPAGERASLPAWGPELPPQPFVAAAPPLVSEEPIELPKSRTGLFVLGAVAVVLVLGLAVLVVLRVAKPAAPTEHDAASIFAVPDAATPSLPPSSSAPGPEAPPSAEPSASAAPSASAPSTAAVPSTAPSSPHTTPLGPGPAKPPPPPAQSGAFNPAVARARLDAANGVLVICKKAGGPSGSGSVAITFAPQGNVTSVGLTVPFVGTPVGDCVRGQFLRVKIPSFNGSPQPMAYTFTVPK